MEKLSVFVLEAGRRGRPRKNPVNDEGREIINDNPDLKKEFGDIELIDPDNEFSKKENDIINKKASKANIARGKEEKEWTPGGATWAIDPPYEDGAVEDIPDEDYTDNLLDLQAKFDADEPFFIQGRAGWGKTSIIEDMAKRAGRHIVTVYLDKAQATDLGGIPVPVEREGVAEIVNAMPDWAAYMLKHRKTKKFLLFFDEMNQAQPDVMNALMPIVLKNVICNIQFDNFMVGAAGNLKEENEIGVNDLSGPLKSRFKPIIIWDSGPEAWKSTFKYLHSKWDKVFGKNVIDIFEKNALLFDNPRELEHKVFKAINITREKAKSNPKVKLSRYNAAWCLRRLQDIVKEELTREEGKQLKELAEVYHKLLVEGPDAFKEENQTRSRRSKGRDQVSDEIKNQIKTAMQRGYMMNDKKDKDGKLVDKRKYGISRENINVFCDMDLSDPESGEVVNAEMLERIINKLEADGIKFKFETNEEWKKAGYVDPYED